MPNRANDWFSQAERDLVMAAAARSQGLHEWGCFAAQQAAEKAVKALHLAHGQEAWGHTITRLLADSPVAPAHDILEKARVLDNFYVPTRYANGHPEGAPFEHYGALQSGQALEYAREIVEFVRVQMADPRRC
jgi:HEPN domain-containing protein